jgi:hypothetical protein
MDRLNLKRIVILTGMWGEKLQQVIDRMLKPHPDRFTVFTEPDWSRIDEPGFGVAMAAQVRDGYARGARGLKITKVLGLNVRDRTGKLTLAPRPTRCGRSADAQDSRGHPRVRSRRLLPSRGRHERALMSWASIRLAFRPSIPAKRDPRRAQPRLRAAPGNEFIALHVANHPKTCRRVMVLDRYPNVVVETEHARGARPPAPARASSS